PERAFKIADHIALAWVFGKHDVLAELVPLESDLEQRKQRCLYYGGLYDDIAAETRIRGTQHAQTLAEVTELIAEQRYDEALDGIASLEDALADDEAGVADYLRRLRSETQLRLDLAGGEWVDVPLTNDYFDSAQIDVIAEDGVLVLTPKPDAPDEIVTATFLRPTFTAPIETEVILEIDPGASAGLYANYFSGKRVWFELEPSRGRYQVGTERRLITDERIRVSNAPRQKFHLSAGPETGHLVLNDGEFRSRGSAYNVDSPKTRPCIRARFTEPGQTVRVLSFRVRQPQGL
ncbi:MAG: hypothetical protein AAF656_13005, partial [Planctomycetota bacterium]